MSRSVDNRVVEMEFDNAKFEKKSFAQPIKNECLEDAYKA